MESERDMYRQFQDWCLRTYGDSGKTKTVTRKKYERIVQLLHGSESSSTDNAKFKFWVKSKGFQLGQPEEARAGGGAQPVLYVPVKTTVSASPASVICLRRQPCGEGVGGDGGAVRHRWLVCPLPPPPPPQGAPTRVRQAGPPPRREALWSFILKRQRRPEPAAPRVRRRCGTRRRSLLPPAPSRGAIVPGPAGRLAREGRAGTPAARAHNRRF